ncbi:hypothetical protein HKX48_004314 [Thoreauomyces humboldtii]|nr:hypothetical protein HKX48_004314 [Thoreauomyces humboldtii]
MATGVYAPAPRTDDDRHDLLKPVHSENATQIGPTPMTKAQKRKAQLNSMANISFNVIIPLALYYILQNKLQLIVVLIISGIPPLLYVLYNAIRYRKIEFVGCVIVVSFIATLILSEVTQNVRILLLKDSITLLLMGVMWLWTLLPITWKGQRIRPLAYQMMADGDPPYYDSLWHSRPRFRRNLKIITALWGVSLTGEFIAKLCIIIFVKDIKQATNMSQILSPAVLGSVFVVQVILSIIFRRQIAQDDAKMVKEAGGGITAV